jgi:hypothetical protein
MCPYLLSLKVGSLRYHVGLMPGMIRHFPGEGRQRIGAMTMMRARCAGRQKSAAMAPSWSLLQRAAGRM